MNLSKNSHLTLATSTKKDGNMSLFKGDSKNILKNREKFLNKFNLNLENIVVLKLTHKAGVHVVTKKDFGKGAKDKLSAIHKDALITNAKNIYLFMLTADCLPIAIYDPNHHAIGLIHASAHNIDSVIEKTMLKMSLLYKTNPNDLICEIGPSIGPCHYPKDLWTQAQMNMESSGVKKANIYNDKICTYSQNYYSHREFIEKNKSEDNRIATLFGMKN